MKILALSDEVLESVHSLKAREQYRDVECVIGCGDLPYYYLEFVVTVLEVPVLYVPGNHDRRWQYFSDDRRVDHAEGCEPLDGRTRRVKLPGGQLLLAGLGGCVRYNANPENQYTQFEMHLRAVQLIPALVANRLATGRYLDILVAHAPPRGVHEGGDPAHLGFDAFHWLMRLFRPRLLLHGHTHVYQSGIATETMCGATRVLNVYPRRRLELDHAVA